MIKLVKKLRSLNTAPLNQCVKAVKKSDGTFEGALQWLRENGHGHGQRGEVLRETNQGLAYAYQHPGGQVSVLVEVNCTTDFTARTEVFQTLCKELAMQIAATPPRWVSVEDIPSVTEANKHTVFAFEAVKTGVANKDDVVKGLMECWYKEVCLLSQTYNRDHNRVVSDLVEDVARATGERIVVRRFVRYEVG